MIKHNPQTMVGDRYKEIVDRLKRVSVWQDKLADNERAFVIDMLDKLNKYRENTYITAKQLNFLTHIEGTLDGGHW